MGEGVKPLRHPLRPTHRVIGSASGPLPLPCGNRWEKLFGEGGEEVEGTHAQALEKSLWIGIVLLSDRVRRPCISWKVRRAATRTRRTSGEPKHNPMRKAAGMETYCFRTGSGDPAFHGKFVEPLRELYEQVGRYANSTNKCG